MRADTPHARAISSITSTTSSRDRSAPPCSSGIVIPMKPAATRSLTLSQGYSSLASHRAARSAITESARSRARVRSACCSAVSSKSIAAPSDVNGLAKRGQRGFEGGLRQRGMGVNRVHDLVEGGFERSPHGELVDDLGRLGADDVHTEDL